jgi:hypothetical protein
MEGVCQAAHHLWAQAHLRVTRVVTLDPSLLLHQCSNVQTDFSFMPVWRYSEQMQKPILFLDFDRTLFDTAQFYDWLGEDVETALQAFVEGRSAEPDFVSMLYGDTLPFLLRARCTHQLVLLTYTMNTPLQEKKIRGSGVAPYFDRIIMTHGTREGKTGKGKAAKDYLATHQSVGKNLFIDDALVNIAEVKSMNPELRCVQIVRAVSQADERTCAAPLPDAVVTDLSTVFLLL